MQKYRPFGDYLVKQSELSVSLTFQEIEQILGFSLPASAFTHRAWWANTLSHPQAGSWLNVGWKISKVKIEQKTALLIRPMVLSIHKIIENGGTYSLTATMNAEEIAFILSGPDASATAGYSWRKIVQMLIDANPPLFGNQERQPDHRIFPEMLARLGYKVVDLDSGES